MGVLVPSNNIKINKIIIPRYDMSHAYKCTVMIWLLFATVVTSTGASSIISTEINANISQPYDAAANFAKTVSDQDNETSLIPDLPDCFSLTMSVEQILNLTYDMRQEFSNASNEDPDGQLLTTCYPIADALKQCITDRVVLDSNSYVHFPENGTLIDSSTGRILNLGDFFMVPADDRSKFLSKKEQLELQDNNEACAIVCNTTQKKSKRMCNYIELSSDKYQKTPTHNGLYLPWRPETLPFAEYETIPNTTESIKLCYPLTKAFRKCVKWVVEKHEVSEKPGFQVYSNTHSLLYDIGEYFFMPSGGVAVCVIPPTGPPPYDYYRVHVVLYAISAACLLLAFIIHILVPSINYHAKPLLCHIFSMMTMYSGLTARKFTPDLTTPTCYTLFIVMHYFALCSFFWLNVLAFDLWRIFADLKSRIGSVPCITCNFMSCRNTRFYSYCAYAWGIPMLITGAAIFLDQVPAAQDALHIPIRIDNYCWLENMRTSLVLFYGPIAIILLENTIFFLLTVWNLRQVSRGTEFVNKKLNKQLHPLPSSEPSVCSTRRVNKVSSHGKMFIVCVKLFVVMGLFWLIEVVSWATGSDRNTWYIPDLINAMQGIVIFIIYICKPTTLKLLRNKLIRSPGGTWTLDFAGSKTNDQRTSSSNISLEHAVGDKSLKQTNSATTTFTHPIKAKK